MKAGTEYLTLGYLAQRLSMTIGAVTTAARRLGIEPDHYTNGQPYYTGEQMCLISQAKAGRLGSGARRKVEAADLDGGGTAA